MRIFITGGTGFIGSALCKALIAEGHQLTVLTRQHKSDTQAVRLFANPSKDLLTPSEPLAKPVFKTLERFVAQKITNSLDGFDAVINLAGEPIFDKRWTQAQKQKLLESRVQLTRQIAEAIRHSKNPPKVLISGSATGIYGNLPTAARVDEQASPFAKNLAEVTACRPHFAAQLCQQWEAEAQKAASADTRVCLLRTGIVLDQNGGALKQMLPLYRAGLGGKLGSGKQYWAWISLQDQVRAIQFLLHNPNSQGTYNLVAPQPVRNAEFNQQLAKALHRPAFFSVPAIALKLFLGERSHLLLDNQPLVPQRLLDEGFTFLHPDLPSYFAQQASQFQ